MGSEKGSQFRAQMMRMEAEELFCDPNVAIAKKIGFSAGLITKLALETNNIMPDQAVNILSAFSKALREHAGADSANEELFCEGITKALEVMKGVTT